MDNNKNNNKTLTHLYSSGKNRLAKVVYMFLYGFVLICTAVIISDNMTFKDSLMAVVIIVAIFEFIKRAFYYVALGTVKPTE